MKTSQQFNSDLEEMLELEPGALKGNEPLDSLNWDSMAVVMFIALADSDYGIEVSANDVSAARTVADLHSILLK